jgi:photosystem II stability/assembly factor-like uncharacterized protein
MLDASQGWALGGGAVLRTADGGRSWQNVTPPGVTLPDNVAASQYGGYFLDAQTAWVVADDRGSKVYRTADGGKTWEQVAPRPEIGSLSFPDAQHGWWLAPMGVAMGSEEVEVRTSTDGWRSWTLVGKSESDVPGALARRGIKTGISFRDASNGWVTALTYQPGFIYLYRTSDGGHTWRLQDLAAPAAFKDQQIRANPPRFFTAKDGILPVTGMDRWDTVFYATHDGGETWAPTAPVKTREGTGGRLLADFADPAHGWASDGVVLYTTTDGGATWKTLTPGTSLANLQELDFVSPEVGWAVVQGEPYLLRTTDGGATWTH